VLKKGYVPIVTKRVTQDKNFTEGEREARINNDLVKPTRHLRKGKTDRLKVTMYGQGGWGKQARMGAMREYECKLGLGGSRDVITKGNKKKGMKIQMFVPVE